MRTSALRGWIILGLLGVSVMLWTVLLLSLLRVINIFDAYLLKMAGPVVVFGAMLLCPLLAAMLALDMVRRRQSPLVGRAALVGGGLLAAAFVILIGVPLLTQARTPATPKNPSTPRPVVPQTGLPVFPGAEGFGTRTPAGRGGKVIEITSLADDGPGTLRAALQDPSPRIIVFRVAGTIELRGELAIAQPFVTVAGQTAPGGGISIKNAGIGISTHDVLIQHLRVRPGKEGRVNPENNDAISILGRHGNVGGAYNVVLDHISASWGEDETISTWYEIGRAHV